MSKKDKKNKGTNKKLFLFLFCLIALFFVFFRYVGELGTWKGENFETYLDRAYTGGSFSVGELPEGAKDFKFQCYNYGLAAFSYAGFTLARKDYDDFLAYVEAQRESLNCDPKEFIGKKVSETIDYYDGQGNYRGLPRKKCDYVIEENLADYTILFYDSYSGAGSHINAVVTKPDTGRIVVICGGSN